ncbi:MAG: tetratricopeptide repeat protein [Proteobacteria bacterium]|nr:tetratricopeptide repeat protein [Pseudomonadota bacterium]MBI3498790.1 tetratricopeptide repeat protein [Pseudomonadota bacterium]
MSGTDQVFQAAFALHQAGRLAEAEALYGHLLSREPNHAEALHFSGVLALSAGRPDEAVRRIARALELAPEAADAHAHLGLAFKAVSRLEEARASLETAVRLDPTDAGKHNNLGVVLRAAGEPMAPRSFRRALVFDPGFAEAHNNLGNAAHDLHDLDQAAARLARAVALRPGYADALRNLGTVLAAGGALQRAVTAYMRALELKPDQLDTIHNLGATLLSLDRVEAALACFRREAASRPGEAGAWGSLGAAEKAQGRIGRAIVQHRRALAIDGDDASSVNNLADALQALGDVTAAARQFRRAIQLRPKDQDMNSNLLFCLCYDAGTSNAGLFAEARQWESRHAAPHYARTRTHANRAEPERLLNLGYVSADFRDHPVGRNVLGLLQHHDRQEIRVHCYAEQRLAIDALTERFRALSPCWRATTGLPDEAIAALIGKDQIDILVLLAGHTGHNRLGVAAHRPAPVQVSFHDVTTSGLGVMDAWLTDAVLHPDDSTEAFTEALVRLPCFYLHRPPDPSPAVAPPPHLSTGRITFGSCNNPAKLGERVIETWSAILRSVPGARLLLKYVDWFADPAVAGRIAGMFQRHGIGPERLDFLGGDLRRVEQLAVLHRIDIALDPFPFNGSTTTFEALWMGVPVVSLAGGRFVGRVGASVSAQLGLDDLVAATTADYVRIAVALAADHGRLARLRSDLRPRLAASPLLDAPAYARSVEQAYRELWRTWCANRRGVRPAD